MIYLALQETLVLVKSVKVVRMSLCESMAISVLYHSHQSPILITITFSSVHAEITLFSMILLYNSLLEGIVPTEELIERNHK